LRVCIVDDIDSTEMAQPTKRPRPVHDDDDHEEGDATAHHVQRKRSRISLAAERDESVVSDEEDEDTNDVTIDVDARGARCESSSDDENDEGDDEITELRATQYIQKSRQEHAENIAAEQGIIEEVFCRNFMCHTKLRIKLGPLINFIIGHNGSGKSAVLTALTMCLGGKATATNRGASLKSLIKEGQESAALAVKIKNQGDNAYKPELYGRSITVERHFSRSGTSGFKIKNADERVISTKKADLDDILDFFAFQLDNPINVLTQDMARQFLSNSSAAEKYKFFIRGTQLETLNADYKLIEEHQNNMEEKLALRADDIKVLRTKAREADAKKKRLDATQSMQEKIGRLERMHAWAQVEEQEQALRACDEALETAEQAVRDKEADAEQIGGVFEGHNQTLESAKSGVAALEEPLAELRDVLSQAKEVFDNNTKEIMNVVAEQRTIRETRVAQKGAIKRMEEEIKEEQVRLSNASGTAYAERLEELESLKEAAEVAKHEHQQHQAHLAPLEKVRDECSTQAGDAEAKVAQAREEVDRAKRGLAGLARDQGRKFAGFPDRMDQLVRDIDRETRWRAKPVGPFGLHVKLVKPEWASIIETTLGGSLNSFAVTCADDQRLLSQILRKYNSQSSIFIGNPRPLDVNGKEPDGDVDTILRVMRIDDDLVRNTLIINHYVEQTVLIKEQEAAMDYMYGSGHRPNVKATIAMTNRPGSGTRYEHSRGGQKSGPVRAWTGAARMQVDRADQTRIQQERVRSAEQEFDALDQERRRGQTELSHAKQACVRWKRDDEKLRIAAQRAEDNVEAKKNEIEASRPQDGKLQELERQLQEAQDELRAVNASYEDSVIAKDRLDETARERKVKMDEANSQLDEAKARLDKAKKRADKIEADRTRALYEKNEAIGAVESSKNNVVRIRQSRDQQQQTVAQYLEGASAVCDRVPVEPGINVAILDERVARLNEDLMRAEREAGGTREELTEAWAIAKNQYLLAKRELDDLKRLERVSRASRLWYHDDLPVADFILQKLIFTLNERQRRWMKFRQYISVRAKINFHYLLSERSFRGRVILDHSSRLLDISVEPDMSKTSDAGRQAKTLSGGEKSFSTICLLLSIWEAIGSPIRCLDEFDVFMDSVNRSTSMTMMIQAARRAVGKQFVLITPQAMNNVEMGDDVRVHRMSDPERGQTALSFAA
jgi:chromosome segregation ATPase